MAVPSVGSVGPPHASDSAVRSGYHSIGLKSSPAGALGWKYVDFWGMTSPALRDRAMAAAGIGSSRNAVAASRS